MVEGGRASVLLPICAPKPECRRGLNAFSSQLIVTTEDAENTEHGQKGAVTTRPPQPGNEGDLSAEAMAKEPQCCAAGAIRSRYERDQINVRDAALQSCNVYVTAAGCDPAWPRQPSLG